MTDPLGVSAGSVDVLDDANLKNSYATIPDQSLDAIAERVAPRQVATGNTRGTQTIMNTDGSYVTIGLIPDGGKDFGIAFFDANDKLISKNIGQTQYVYDQSTGKNIIQIGKLPDGTYGMVVAKPGFNVSEIFS